MALPIEQFAQLARTICNEIAVAEELAGFRDVHFTEPALFEQGLCSRQVRKPSFAVARRRQAADIMHCNDHFALVFLLSSPAKPRAGFGLTSNE